MENSSLKMVEIAWHYINGQDHTAQLLTLFKDKNVYIILYCVGRTIYHLVLFFFLPSLFLKAGWNCFTATTIWQNLDFKYNDCHQTSIPQGPRVLDDIEVLFIPLLTTWPGFIFKILYFISITDINLPPESLYYWKLH